MTNIEALVEVASYNERVGCGRVAPAAPSSEAMKVAEEAIRMVIEATELEPLHHDKILNYINKPVWVKHLMYTGEESFWAILRRDTNPNNPDGFYVMTPDGMRLDNTLYEKHKPRGWYMWAGYPSLSSRS